MIECGWCSGRGSASLNKEFVSGINPQHDVQTLIDFTAHPQKGQIAVAWGNKVFVAANQVPQVLNIAFSCVGIG